MKRFIGLFVATIAAVVPLSAAGAAPAPAEYQAGCDQLYNAGKAVFDQVIANAKDAAASIEKTFCGENKYAK